MDKLSFCSGELYKMPGGCQSSMQRRIRNARTRLRTLEQEVLPPSLQHSPPRDVVLNASGWVIAICAVALLLGGFIGGLLLAEKLESDTLEAAESD